MTRTDRRPAHPPSRLSYWVVETEDVVWYVDDETAARIGRKLSRMFLPRWIRFRDYLNRPVWIRAKLIHSIYYSTPNYRKEWRDMTKALEREER